MKELIDIVTSERLGLEYTADELRAAHVAVGIYRRELHAGTICDDPAVIEDGVGVCDTIERTLGDGNVVIDPKTHQVVRDLPISFLGRINRTLRIERYPEMSERFGITVFDLAYYGMIASCMMEDKGLELVPIFGSSEQSDL